MKPKAKPLPANIKIHVPIDFAIRGGRKLIIGEVPRIGARRRIDNALIKAIARSYRWQEMIESGEYASIAELAEAEGINSYPSKIFRLTLLAPDLVEGAARWSARQQPCRGRAQKAPFSRVERTASSPMQSRIRPRAIEL